MLPTVIGICFIAYIFLVLIFFLSNKGNTLKDETVLIKAPSELEIQKEKEGWEKTEKEKSFTYPDKEFELIVRYILDKDPNPRKVVKLIQTGFSEKDKKMLMLCLSINNPILYNEVASLQYCDSSKYEDFQEKVIDIEEKFDSTPPKTEIQGGIPANFFLNALEYDKDPDNVLDNINTAFENLPVDEQEAILKHCEKIRKNKREKAKKEDKSQNSIYSEIMKDADEDAEEFMRLYKESLNRN